MNKEKTLIKTAIILLSTLVLVSSVYAFIINSTNYKQIPVIISSGGTNISSSNYRNIIVSGIISGTTSSTAYTTSLGFFYVSTAADTTPPTWNNNQTNISGTKYGDTFWVSVNWSDETALDDIWLSIQNYSGWHNLTPQDTGGANSYFYNTTYTMDMVRGQIFNWTFYANDTAGNINCSDIWSYNVSNSLPTISNLIYPENNGNITNRTSMFRFNATDPDGDELYFDIFIDCVSCSADDRTIYNNSGLNYTPSAELQYFIDDNYYYTWYVRAFDNLSYGTNSSVWNFSLQSLVAVSLPTGNVDFGAKYLGDIDNTTDNSPPPLVLQNDGNCFIDVNISAIEELWGSGSAQMPSSYFRYKVDNVAGEEGAFNWSNSTTSWANMPLVNGTFINLLNYSDARDSAEIDLEITVPPDEPSGKKNTTILFTGYYVKVVG